jgi:hypothetical protein
MRARDNPFAIDRVHQVRYRFLHTTWDDFLDRLAALDYRAALVGPDGSGKTTLLEDLDPYLRARNFDTKRLRLTREIRTFPRGFLKSFVAGLSDRDLVLFDGADHMKSLAWRRFERQTRKAGGLIIASHRPGLLPTLLECATTPALLAEILEELMGEEAAALADKANHLFEKHQGNIRDVLRGLYDVYAGRGAS